MISCSLRNCFTSFIFGIDVCAPFLVTEIVAAAWLNLIAFSKDNPDVIEYARYPLKISPAAVESLELTLGTSNR